jgi:hypothetical protein
MLCPIGITPVSGGWPGRIDTGLACCFAAAARLGLRRRAALPLLAVAAALLCCDA